MAAVGDAPDWMSAWYRMPFRHETPYVVSADSPRHNSPVEWAVQGPLPRLRLPIQHEIRRNVQLPVLQVEQLAEQRREQLSVQLLKQLLELLAVQLREQLRIQVKVKLKIQMQTHVLVQVSTQLRIPLRVLPGEFLRVLLDEHQPEVPARNLAVQTGCVAHTISRGTGRSKQTF